MECDIWYMIMSDIHTFCVLYDCKDNKRNNLFQILCQVTLILKILCKSLIFIMQTDNFP